MSKIISVDFFADFGIFKKPDINDTIYLTYNFIHKPVVIGIFGAILGLKGHKKEGELPDYYKKLQDIKIGIEPIGKHKNGNFEKILVKYNDATGISGSGPTLNVLEQVLVKPGYRVYVEIDEDSDLHEELRKRLGGWHKNFGEATFIPYFGKNEFHCWWENYKDDYEVCDLSDEFRIATIFSKPTGNILKNLRKKLASSLEVVLGSKNEKIYIMFERLPVRFDDVLHQYAEPEEFVYTNMTFNKQTFFEGEDPEKIKEHFKEVKDSTNGKRSVIYLF